MDSKIEMTVLLALEKEELSYNHYLKLLKNTTNYNLQKLFTTLAIQELKHEALLKQFLKTGDFILAKEEAYKRQFDNYTITDKLQVTIETFSLKKELFKAIKRENDAYVFYMEMFEKSIDKNIKDLFYFLSLEEMNHEHLLRKEYNKL
jgi:rubrerythrin